mmetsp:Transcript_5620/g.17769  ORF Transcript_5620/g.17769 Transcript_5620/m.17769 type:complete len:323 (+) Transcript_5620:253-1221(+)
MRRRKKRRRGPRRRRNKPQPEEEGLLKDLAVGDLFALEEEVDVGGPELVDEGLHFVGDGSLDFGPVVVLGVVVAFDEVFDGLAAEEPEAGDFDGLGAEVLGARDEHGAEGPLPDLARALDEAAHQVGRHELLGVFFVVLVPAEPERPARGIEHFPELLHRHFRRVVRVDLLPHVAHERRRRLLVQNLQRVVLLLLRLGLVHLGSRCRSLRLRLGLLLLLLLLRLLLLLLLLLVVLLLRRLVLLLRRRRSRSRRRSRRSRRRTGRRQLGVGEDDVADDGDELGLVDAEVEPAHHVRELRAELGAHGELCRVHERRGQGDVRQS